MADIECPECGHRALSAASRCPRCGHEFTEEQLRHRPPMPGRRPLRRGPFVLAAVLLLVVLLLARRGIGGNGAHGEGRGRDTTPAAAPTVFEDTGATAAEPVPAADSAPPAVDPSTVTPPPPAEPPRPASGTPVRRWATEWVNVRKARGSRAPVVRVLEPGDAVLVDSLRRGWYRIVADGLTIGYADRRYLGTTPPERLP